MSDIKKSQLDAVDTRVEVMLRKLFEGRYVNFEDINGVDILNADDEDTIFYNFTLDLWENHPLKTINGESLKGPGDIVVTGGGGTPGGTSGQFQWNDSGAFGGTSGFTWNSGTNLPQSTNGYEFGGNSSIAEAAVGLSTISSMSFNPISGLIAGVELESNGSTSCIVRLNTNRGLTNKFFQVENDKTSPRYFDGSALQDVWHTGTFDPSTKQDTITAGTGLAFSGTTLNVSTNLAGWNGITTGSKQDTLVSGTNIKSINGNSLLGSGDLVISGGSSTAASITYDNSSSGLAATNVQDAIDELEAQTIVIPDAQIVSAIGNSFALKHDPLLYSPTGGYFDIVAPQSNGSASAHSRAFRGDFGGKWYFEIAVAGTVVSGSTAIGVAQPSTDAAFVQVGANGSGVAQSWALLGDGRKYSGSAPSYGDSYAAGDVIMGAVDMSLSVGSRKIWWGKNGTWMASGDPVAGTGEAFANLPTRVCPAVTPSTAILTLRLRASEFSYSIPSGFSAWVT